MIKKTSKLFVSEFIPKVSRTFALAIQFLPPDLRHSVFTAYLLCRVADTIEDSRYIPTGEKCRRLKHLNKLLISAATGKTIAPAELIPLYSEIDPLHGHDHRLLNQSAELFDILNELPKEKSQIIYHWAGEMAGGMAEFSQLLTHDRTQIRAFESSDQWDRYCYFVAGTVGHMLTELFIEQYRLDGAIAVEMNRLCDSFGLGLQKVNTIKDVPGDIKHGIVFLPKDIMRKYGLSPQSLGDASNQDGKKSFVYELVEIASAHLDDAIEYTVLLPARLKGIRMFLTVPVFLAQETINLINRNPVQTLVGPPVKISRRDVVRLTAMARLHSPSNEALRKYYQKLKRKL